MYNAAWTVQGDEAVAAIERGFAKLVAKADKLGAPRPTYVTEIKKLTDRTGEVFTRTTFHVSYERIALNGWSLVAALDRIDGASIIRTVPGAIVPDRYTAESSECDHCRTNRFRLTTYVLQHEDGRYVRVGSTCIADFLGHSVSALLFADEIFATIGGIAEGSYGPGVRAWAIERVLAFASAEVREHGFMSRKAAGELQPATADRVSRDLNPTVHTQVTPITDADLVAAEEALAWATSITDEACVADTFTHNVRALARHGSVTWKHMGIAVYILVAWQKARGTFASQTRTAPSLSMHVGTVGAKVVVECTVTETREIEGHYGVTTLVKFVDASGNVLVWYASGSKSEEWPVDKKVKIKGGVKAHKEFRGVLETVLTRVLGVA